MKLIANAVLANDSNKIAERLCPEAAAAMIDQLLAAGARDTFAGRMLLCQLGRIEEKGY